MFILPMFNARFQSNRVTEHYVPTRGFDFLSYLLGSSIKFKFSRRRRFIYHYPHGPIAKHRRIRLVRDRFSRQSRKNSKT